MTHENGRDDNSFNSLKIGSTDSSEVESYYDDWADDYDAALESWQYQAPDDASELISKYLKVGSRVLDVGCGTGLLSHAMAKHGNYVLDGMDISQASLRLAERRGTYATLIRHDLQKLPLPVADHVYDAAVSVGVFTYIEDAEGLCRDLCRCVRKGGVVSFTQRSDLWNERDFPKIISRIEAAGLWRNPRISQPKQYLPGHEDFSEEIRVIHTLAVVT